ncbi:MAG TPA: hypothetical protein VHZ03_21960 [Trebonia sp.]|nr:hypothetical protein [Trebonia sp.]
MPGGAQHPAGQHDSKLTVQVLASLDDLAEKVAAVGVEVRPPRAGLAGEELCLADVVRADAGEAGLLTGTAIRGPVSGPGGRNSPWAGGRAGGPSPSATRVTTLPGVPRSRAPPVRATRSPPQSGKLRQAGDASR